MKATKRMLADAERDGAQVTQIKKVTPAPKPNSGTGKPNSGTERPAQHIAKDPAPSIQALRAEIAELRSMVVQTKSDADRRVQELSAIIAALSQTKPVRVKPVRDLDPQSKTYLLVSHYDFIPVTHRKLDS